MTVTSSKPARADQRRDLLFRSTARTDPVPRFRRLLQPALDQHRPVRRRPGVAVCRRPRGERERAPGAEHAPGLAQRAGRIRHEHVAEAGDDRVDARVREVDLLHVHDAVLRIRDSAASSRLDHHRRKVGRDHARDPAGNRLGDVARCRRQGRARRPSGCGRSAARSASVTGALTAATSSRSASQPAAAASHRRRTSSVVSTPRPR